MTVSPLVSKVKLNPAFDKGERLTAAVSERDELFSLLLAALPALHTCRRPKPLPCSHSHTHTHMSSPHRQTAMDHSLNIAVMLMHAGVNNSF